MANTVTEWEIQKARLRALVVPAAERDALERRYGVRPALLSALIGFWELVLGLALYAIAHPGVPGMLGWLLWHANPLAWLGLLTIAVGFLRIINFFVNNDSFGEPLVWCFMRLRQSKREGDESKRVRREFGPQRPDRVIVDDDGHFVLLASREKPDWDEYRTVRIEDEFFKIESVGERRNGPYMAVAYALVEVPESEVLRGIVHSDAKLPAPSEGA